jgi:hypothetical protein
MIKVTPSSTLTENLFFIGKEGEVIEMKSFTR